MSFYSRPESSGTVVKGKVKKIVFQAPDTGFVVLSVQDEETNRPQTVTGICRSVKEGEEVKCAGEMVRTKYGMQLKAELIQILPPSTEEGALNYLSSGMIEGIGPECAKALVGTFGTGIFDILNESPERLREAPGIGAKRAAKIQDAWKEQRAVYQIMVFLQGQGVSSSKAHKIYKKYGAEAVDKVRSNPYLLCRDIQGFGFLTADRIALNLGLDPYSPFRAKALIQHVLKEASSYKGHCCLPFPVLVQEAEKIAELPVELLKESVEEELDKGRLFISDEPEEQSIYSPRLFEAELGIVSGLGKLLESKKVPWDALKIEEALAKAEKTLGFELEKTQREAVKAALSNKVTVITGGPGTGKTTIVRAVLECLKELELQIDLCAPTGKAAKRLSASSGKEAFTIHRLLGVNPEDGYFLHEEDNPLETDFLIVDECSMMDVLLAKGLLSALKPEAAVLFVGDADQLPSVGPGTFFSSLLDSGMIPAVRLSAIFRQKAGSDIVTAAHAVNDGKMPSLSSSYKKDFIFLSADDPEVSKLIIANLVSKVLPEKFGLDPLKDVQVLSPMRKGACGVMALNQILQERLNPSQEDGLQRSQYAFYVGDKVMQIENDYEKGVFNGDSGFITKIDKEESVLTVDFEGKHVSYKFSETDALILCYAGTIHKSQGSEYSAVVMPVTMQHFHMLRRNLLYTGITRGKKKVILVGERQALQMAVRAKDSSTRYTGLAQRLQKALKE